MNNRQFYKAVDSTRRLSMVPGVKIELNRNVEELMAQIEGSLAAERSLMGNLQALNRVRYLIGDEGGVIQAEIKTQTEALRKVRDYLREEVV